MALSPALKARVLSAKSWMEILSVALSRLVTQISLNKVQQRTQDRALRDSMGQKVLGKENTVNVDILEYI